MSFAFELQHAAEYFKRCYLYHYSQTPLKRIMEVKSKNIAWWRIYTVA